MLPRGRNRPKKDPTSAGDAKSDSTQDPGNRQALPKNFVDRTIPILRRQPQVAMKEISEVVEILFQQRPVQLVFDQKLFLDVCRQFSLPIKRAPRHQMDQKKSERDDTKEDDYQGDPSFGDETEHSGRSLGFGARSQNTENRIQKSEVRSQKSEVGILAHDCGNVPVPSNAPRILPKTALLPLLIVLFVGLLVEKAMSPNLVFRGG